MIMTVCSEQAAFPWFSGEWSKSYSGLLWATNWNSKSLCHLSLKAVFGRGVWEPIDQLWSPAYGEMRWVRMAVRVLGFFFSFLKIRNMIKAACTGHKRCIPHPFLTHYTLMHCIRLDCCSPSGVLINSRELIECLSQCWRRPWDIPLSARLTFWFICLDFALISLPAPFLLGKISFPVWQSWSSPVEASLAVLAFCGLILIELISAEQ